MRSTERSVASSTMALPMFRARTVRPFDEDAVLLAEEARLLERLAGALLLVGERRVERHVERDEDDVERDHEAVRAPGRA